MRAIYFVSLWLHIVAATIWIGGMVFFALVLVPLSRRPEFGERGPALLQRAGERFRLVGWICLATLVVTGVANLHFHGFGWADVGGRLWQGAWGHALAHKLALVAVILVLSAVHDFYVGPKASALAASAPTAKATIRLRKTASWFARVNLLLALCVVALALVLVRGGA